MTNKQPLRILLADDHAAVRRGLRSMLQPQWEICAEASDGREAIEQARATQPDVVLLDLNMPQLNGLEAARAILRDSPGTHVLLLTMQPTEELRGDAERAGVELVLAKSDGEKLAAFLTEIERRTVHLADRVLRSAPHVGAFFASQRQHYEVLRPFIAEGLSRGEKAFHIVNGADRDLHTAWLAGPDVEFRQEKHSGWELASWDEMYLAEGRFDLHAMLDRIRRVFTTAVDDGFPSTRLVANMEWALEQRPGVADVVEYESRLNDMLPLLPGVVVCAYDLTRFSGHLIIDVMRAHPTVIVGGALFANPFYVAPEAFMAELNR
jgi:DNA-binding NarL/FixJ family response regulator